MFNMFFDGLLCYFESIRDFLIGPTLSKVLDNRLFSIRKLKPLFGLIGIKLLAAAKLFQGHY